MKKYFFSALFLLGAACMQAQDYTVESRIEEYENLVNPSPLAPDDPDEWQMSINQNFNFSIFGEGLPNKFVVDGGIAFINGSQTILTGVLTHWDWVLRPDSKISYKISGTAGSKLLQVEFKNMGFFDEIDLGSQEDFMNVQIWLYEGSNKAEMHFGPSSTQVLSESGNKLYGNIGLARESSSSVKGNMLQGSEENPYIVVDNSTEYSYFTGVPSEGRVFEFCPVGICSSADTELAASDVSIYPNPATDKLFVKGLETAENIDLSIWNALGQQLGKTEPYMPGAAIDLSAYPSGYLMIRLEQDGQYRIFRITKI